jgi:Carbohydrate esterase, sialic acid-specific acetylesterase
MQQSTVSPPDPFTLFPVPAAIGLVNINTNGLAVRSLAINPAIKTLVLITMGQSLMANANANTTSTVCVPTNPSVIDNFNIYDGAAYQFSTAPALGCNGTNSNVAPRIADMFINNGQFNRVIVVPIAVGSTAVADWATGNYASRFQVAMNRLAARGITPASTGVTFAAVWGQGETDTANSTLQAAYASSLNTVISNAFAAGFSGRFFVNIETWNAGSVSAAVQAAQAAVVNNTTVFQGANWDTFGSADRMADNTHPNDVGAPLFASALYNAMHASGAPF